MNTRWNAEPTELIDVGHSRLAYYRYGSGPDVVFVHGWPVHAATFRHLVAELAQQFTCHLFDLPGTGASEWSGESEVGLSQHARSLITAIDTLGLKDYAMIAHDSGAVMARLVAAEHASRVRGLVLGNTEIPGHRPWMVQAMLLMNRLPMASGGLGALLKYGWLRRSKLGLGACFEDPRYGDGEFFELFVRPLLNSRRAFAGQMMLVANLDWQVVDHLDEVHTKIGCPVQLVWGPDDPYFPQSKAEGMLGQFPGGATLVSIPRARLFAHEDHAAEFLQLAQPFLQDCLCAPALAHAG